MSTTTSGRERRTSWEEAIPLCGGTYTRRGGAGGVRRVERRRAFKADIDGPLDNLDTTVHGFVSAEPHHLALGSDCRQRSKRKMLPGAALATGFWKSDLRKNLRGATYGIAAAAAVQTLVM